MALRGVRTRAEFGEYVARKGSRSVNPFDVAAFKRGIPLYFSPKACEVCHENLTAAHPVSGEGQA